MATLAPMACALKTLFLFFVTLAYIHAQAPINILTLQQGLPKSQIYDIVQDSFGFIWLGTRDGLVKYDGHEMTLFRKSAGKLPFNYCYDLFIDDTHQLWMASNADYQGIARLDLEHYEFYHYNSDSIRGLANNGVVAIKQTTSGKMVFATKDFQLSILDEQQQDVLSFNLNDYLSPRQIPIVDVTDLFCDPINEQLFWLCTREGLARFDAGHLQLQFWPGVEWRPVHFYHDSQTHPMLWVAMEGQGGLMQINLEDPEQLTFRSIRLLEARKLLQNTDLNINEICYDVGFSNPSYFSKMSIKAFGLRPSAFRPVSKLRFQTYL